MTQCGLARAFFVRGSVRSGGTLVLGAASDVRYGRRLLP
jgi:hypothetical protein